MAITICPECGKEISSTAKACPNCGYSLQKGKNTTLWCKIAFCIVNLVYLWRRLSLKDIVTYSVLDIFYDYFDNREIDNYEYFDFISPLQLATTSSDGKYILIIVLMIIAFILSIAFIMKNKFNLSIAFFSAIPILSELFFIFADGTYIESNVVGTSPFSFVTLKYIFLGIAISIIEFIIYKKLIQPTITISANTVEQTSEETIEEENTETENAETIEITNEEAIEQVGKNITEQKV